MEYLPVLEIFMAVLGFGLTIMFCTTFCRACSRLREEQIEREAWRRTEHDGRPPSIYVIPFPRSLSQDSDDMLHRHSPELAPQYNGAFCEPPPAYSELGIKPDDLPPAYTEYSVPMYSPHSVSAAAVQPHSSSHSQSPSNMVWLYTAHCFQYGLLLCACFLWGQICVCSQVKHKAAEHSVSH